MGLLVSICSLAEQRGSRGSINLISIFPDISIWLILFFISVQLCQTPQPRNPRNPVSIFFHFFYQKK
eukprot:COSAG03_NODE_605_length_6748_cov_9.478869_4_plen_67_part_00